MEFLRHSSKQAFEDADKEAMKANEKRRKFNHQPGQAIQLFRAVHTAEDPPRYLHGETEKTDEVDLFKCLKRQEDDVRASLTLIFLAEVPDRSWCLTKPAFKQLYDDWLKMDPSLLCYVLSSRSGWYTVMADDGTCSFLLKDYMYTLLWSFNPDTLETRAMMSERSDYKDLSGLRSSSGHFIIPGLSAAHLYHPLSLALVALADFVHYCDALMVQKGYKIGDIERQTGHGDWQHYHKERKQPPSPPPARDASLALETRRGSGQKPAPGTGWRARWLPTMFNGSPKPPGDQKAIKEVRFSLYTDAYQAIASIIGIFANMFKSVKIAKSIVDTLEHNQQTLYWRHLLETRGKTVQDLRYYDVCDRSFQKASCLLQRRLCTMKQSGRVLHERAKAQSSVVHALMSREETRIGLGLAESSSEHASDMKVIAMMTMAFLPATFIAGLFDLPTLEWDKPLSDVIGDNFWVYWAFALPTTLLVFATWDIFNRFALARAAWSLATRSRRGRRRPVPDEEGQKAAFSPRERIMTEIPSIIEEIKAGEKVRIIF